MKRLKWVGVIALSGWLLWALILWTPVRAVKAVNPPLESAKLPQGPYSQPPALTDRARIALPVDATATKEGGPQLPAPESTAWDQAAPALRGPCSSFNEDDKKDFVRMALKWESGGSMLHPSKPPDYTAKEINPDGTALGPVDVEELDGIVDSYNKLLTEMAEDAADLTHQCLLDYFDKGMHLRFRDGDPHVDLPDAPALRGLYTRQSTISRNGWTVQTRFTSVDYPQLEILLDSIDALRKERLAAVMQYIKHR